MKVHAAIAQALVDHEVDTMFGVLGEANMLIVDDFIHLNGGNYVSAAREDAAVMMADGFARVSNRLGIATVTQGPGLTNTVTAITEASRMGTPMLLLVGDTPADSRFNIQEIDHRSVVQATGAGFQHVSTANAAVEDVAIAIRRAFLERRPVILNVPGDLQEQDVEYVPFQVGLPAAQAVAPDPNALDRAVGIIAHARRPLVLAGRGAVRSGARENLLALADRLGAPVATTLLAKDFFRGTAWNIGIFGTLSSKLAAEVIAQADCIAAFGASLNEFTTAHGALTKGKAIVQCDLSLDRVDDGASNHVGILGDAAVVADHIVDWLNKLESEPSPFRSQGLEHQILEYSAREEIKDVSRDGTVDLRTASILLDELLPEQRTVVTDVGHAIMAAPRYLHVPEPQAFVFPANFGAVGLGLGAAIGAAVARPDRPVIAVVGDGGLMMSFAEFNTAVRYSLDLTVVVLNDCGYGSEYHDFALHGRNPDMTLFRWPDFASVAQSLGGQGMTVRKLNDLQRVPRWFEQRDSPLLIDVRLDPALHLETCVF